MEIYNQNNVYYANVTIKFHVQLVDGSKKKVYLLNKFINTVNTHNENKVKLAMPGMVALVISALGR